MARTFNKATSDKIVYPHLSALDGATMVTTSFWVFPVTTTTSYDAILGQIGASGSGPGNTTGFQILHHINDARRLFIACRNNSASPAEQYSDTTLVLNVWNHVIVQYDGTQATATDRIRVWVNNTEVSGITVGTSTPTSLGTTDQPFQIGNSSEGGGSLFWSGRLADVVVWTGLTLTAAERTALYAGARISTIQPAAQVFRDEMLDNATPQNVITAEAGTTTGTVVSGHPVGTPSTGITLGRYFNRAASEKITYPHITALDGASLVAISLWFYYESYGSFDQLLSQHDTGGVQDGISVYLPPATRSIGVGFKNATNSYDTYNSVLTQSAWNHILVQYDGSQPTGANSRVKTWVNGTLRTPSTRGESGTTVGTTSLPLALGVLSDGTFPLSGGLADVAIWTGVTLTDTERLQLISGQRAETIQTAALVFYEPFREGQLPKNHVTDEAGTVTGTVEVGGPASLVPTNRHLVIAKNVWEY